MTLHAYSTPGFLDNQIPTTTQWNSYFSGKIDAGADLAVESVVTTGCGTVRSLGDRFSDFVNLKDFGAVGNGIADDTASVQAAIVACTNKILLVPSGKYKISSAVIGNGPITVMGMNGGGGPGLSSDNVSMFLCADTFTTGDMFIFATVYAVNFHDIKFAERVSMSWDVPSTRVSGAALHLSPAASPGATNATSNIERCSFIGFTTGLLAERTVDLRVVGNYFQSWKTDGYKATDGGVATESSVGYLMQNKFFGAIAANSQTSCMQLSCGYGSVLSNLLVGAQKGIYVNNNQLNNSGSMMIAFNSIEEQNLIGVHISQSGTTYADNITIAHNEFSNITNQGIAQHVQVTADNSDHLYNIDISGNKFQSFLTGTGGNGIMISVQAGNHIRVCDNIMVGSGFYGVVIGANPLDVDVHDNKLNGTSMQGSVGGYAFNAANVVLRDLSTRAITVANLGTYAEGSQVYVSDGQQSSDGPVVIAGGSGCIAFRSHGAWLTIPNLTTGVRVNGAGGPIWIAGTGAPASTQPLGSLWSRTDGGVGSTLYVSRGGGSWNAVAGV